MEREPPPQLGPDDILSPEHFSRLAREILREMAQHDPTFEQRLRDEGIDIEG